MHPSLTVVIPRSTRPSAFSGFSPHWVNYAGKREFRVRHDRGNQLMDIGEIRHAFVEATQLPERIEEYRRLRASIVLANEAPVELLGGMTIMLQFMPLSSFGADAPLVDLVDTVHATRIASSDAFDGAVTTPLAQFGVLAARSLREARTATRHTWHTARYTPSVA